MVKVAILHEGNAKKTNDNELLELLIHHLGLDKNKVEFFGVGSKNNFFKIESPVYKDLKLRIEEGAVSKIFFVINADYEKNDSKYGGFYNCKKELETTVKTLCFTCESDIYVTCNPQIKEGYLESLILSSIQKKEKDCIETFLECSSYQSKENDKAILNQIYKSAYPNAPFNFEHENFNQLKQKLQNLFN